MLELVEEITNCLDNNKYSIGVFIDLKKAFDTVDHDVLAKKKFYGVHGIAHKWIMSYLENRSQIVQYKNCDSVVLRICCGIPQGPILGPKLFIMYINDIFNASKLLKFILFADDTNMFYCNNDINELIRQTNAKLDKLNVWFSLNRLSLNIAKTNYTIFGNHTLKKSLSIKINKVTIKVEETKFLGVLIDDKLKWKHHISLLKSKLSKCCLVMYKTSFLIDRRGMRILYYSLFSPYIMYCAEIWGNTYASNLKCLVLLQKKFVRLICGAQRLDHTSTLFYDFHILKLLDMVKLKTAEIMYKAYNNSFSFLYDPMYMT